MSPAPTRMSDASVTSLMTIVIRAGARVRGRDAPGPGLRQSAHARYQRDSSGRTRLAVEHPPDPSALEYRLGASQSLPGRA